jgi:hypothetical protein
MEQNTAWTAIAGFVCAFLAFMCFAIWQNAVNNTENGTVRMSECVKADKDWVYVDDANTFQCIGGRN